MSAKVSSVGSNTWSTFTATLWKFYLNPFHLTLGCLLESDTAYSGNRIDPGNSISVNVSTYEGCRHACEQTFKCFYWSYVRKGEEDYLTQINPSQPHEYVICNDQATHPSESHSLEIPKYFVITKFLHLLNLHLHKHRNSESWKKIM